MLKSSEVSVVLILFFVNSVLAEVQQSSEIVISPPIQRVPFIPLLGPQKAPSSSTTEGPAGRPNLELSPLSSGTLNSLTESMKKGSARAQNRAPADAEISREASSPLPNDNDSPVKSNQNPQ